MNFNIKTADITDSEKIAKIVREANIPVAKTLGLTKLNAAKHPSHCTKVWIESDIERGVQYFIAEKDSIQIGCVALEMPEQGTAYLNRLAVLPEYQSMGIGKKLVDFHIQYSK